MRNSICYKLFYIQNMKLIKHKNTNTISIYLAGALIFLSQFIYDLLQKFLYLNLKCQHKQHIILKQWEIQVQEFPIIFLFYIFFEKGIYLKIFLFCLPIVFNFSNIFISIFFLCNLFFKLGFLCFKIYLLLFFCI